MLLLQVFQSYPLTPIELWTPDLAMFFYKYDAAEKWHEWNLLLMCGSNRIIEIVSKMPKLHVKFQFDIDVACAAVEANNGIIDQNWGKSWSQNIKVIHKALDVNAEAMFPRLAKDLQDCKSIQWRAVNSREPYLADFNNIEWVLIALGHGYPPSKLVCDPD